MSGGGCGTGCLGRPPFSRSVSRPVTKPRQPLRLACSVHGLGWYRVTQAAKFDLESPLPKLSISHRVSPLEPRARAFRRCTIPASRDRTVTMLAVLAAVLVILSSPAGAQECFGFAKKACHYLKRQPEHRVRTAVEQCERESPGASGSGVTFCAANKLGMRARRPRPALSDDQWVQRCLAIQPIDDRISCWEALASARRRKEAPRGLK